MYECIYVCNTLIRDINVTNSKFKKYNNSLREEERPWSTEGPISVTVTFYFVTCLGYPTVGMIHGASGVCVRCMRRYGSVWGI